MENKKLYAASRYACGAIAMVALLMLAPIPARAAQVSIAAVVGDDIITSSDLTQRRDVIIATAGIPATIENQQKLTPRIMQSLIDETLQVQEAKRNSFIITDEEVTQALDAMGPIGAKGEPIRDFIKQRGLSLRSVENQMRAQLAWGKVVQRKLRRNVSISQDEVRRAQQSQAAAPGVQELRVGALEIAISDSSKEADAAKLADEIMLQLKSGTDMATIAARYIRQSDVQYRSPTWVQEKSLPPALQQALRAVKTGEFTLPLPSPNLLQILQVVDRKVAPKQADTTEYAIKQITIGVPKKRDKASTAKLRSVASELRSNPGGCMDEAMPKMALPVDVKYIRARLGGLSPELRGVISHLEVGDVSEPLLSADAVRLMMMCEKIEPAEGNVPDAEKVRQELFTEKLELEAQKYLRNLRRDAFIDIKGAR